MIKIKPGFSTVIFDEDKRKPETIEELVDFIRDERVGGVELRKNWLGDRNAEEIKEIGRILEDEKIDVYYAIKESIIYGDEEKINTDLKGINDAIKCATLLNAKGIRIFPGEVDYIEDFKKMMFPKGVKGCQKATSGNLRKLQATSGNIRQLQETPGNSSQPQATLFFYNLFNSCLQNAKSKGISLMIENPPHKQNGKSENIEKVLNNIGYPDLKMTFDTGNFYIVGEEPSSLIPKFLGFIELVHFKDIKKDDKTGNLIDTFIGDGEINFEAVICNLKKLNYNGLVCLEFSGKGEGYKRISKSLNFLRGLS